MWALALLIIPAFVLWGSSGSIRSKGLPKYAGKIFGKKVSFGQFEAALSASRNRALLIYGDQFNKVAEYLDLENQAWEQLILLDRARKERIKVSNQEVIDIIKTLTFFQEEGKFSQERYNILLDYVFRTNPRDFEEQIRELITIEQLTQKVTQDINLNDEEIKKAYKEEHEKATAEYVLIEPQDFTGQIHPSYEELQEYYGNQKEQFKKPEQVNVEYFALYFDQTQEEPVQEKNKEMLEEKIWQISDQIEEAPSFETVADYHQLEIKETGFFAPQEVIPDIGLSYEFSNVAFSLEADQISNVIETPKGYFIIKLKEKRASYIPFFEEIKAEINKALVEQRSWQVAEGEAEELLSRIKEKAGKKRLSFVKAAKKLSLEVKEAEEFSRFGYIPGIGQSRQFSQAAFELKSGEISGVIAVPTGYCILSLKSIVPIDEEKFIQEKEEYSQRLLAKKKAVYFKGWLEGLKKSANLVSNLDKLKNKPPAPKQ
jgi:peptidyl-prolyl cis-trans isomerase D